MRTVRTTQGRAVPFRIEFLLDQPDLAAALSYSVKDDDEDEALPTLTRSAAVERIRETLTYVGAQTYHYWSDYVDGEREGQISSWAEETVQRLFGDLFPADGGR